MSCSFVFSFPRPRRTLTHFSFLSQPNLLIFPSICYPVLFKSRTSLLTVVKKKSIKKALKMRNKNELFRLRIPLHSILKRRITKNLNSFNFVSLANVCEFIFNLDPAHPQVQLINAYKFLLVGRWWKDV